MKDKMIAEKIIELEAGEGSRQSAMDLSAHDFVFADFVIHIALAGCFP